MTVTGTRSVWWRTPAAVITAGCLIGMVGFGIRSIFGLFLAPMTLEQDWSRETFALALAIQNLLWGVGLPFAGALADRFGPRYVLAGGSVVYAAGVWGMARSHDAGFLYLTAGVVVGLGVALTAFSLAMVAIARAVGPDRRSLALGLGTASGSLGQVVFSPLGQSFINSFGWHQALLLLAAISLLMIPLAYLVPNTTTARGEVASDQTMGEALSEAAGHRGFLLLTAGFFACGFHIAFITVHFPAFVLDLGFAAVVGAVSIALIGVFNIVGSFGSGIYGQQWSKRKGLVTLYALRAVVTVIMLLAPKGEVTVYLFACVLGVLWLATVPLTSGIVEQVFGVRYLATLFGIVFLSHQVGSFIGVWLGGFIFDQTGAYTLMWWISVFVNLAAAAIHLPIDERPLRRVVEQQGARPPGHRWISPS